MRRIIAAFAALLMLGGSALANEVADFYRGKPIMATIANAEFLSETTKVQLTIDPTSGDEMEQVIRDAYNLPASTIERVRKALITP